ncbi:MAG: hypothetical protein ACLFV4_05875, partial [Candidatus Hydrogenedentota bacterium]
MKRIVFVLAVAGVTFAMEAPAETVFETQFSEGEVGEHPPEPWGVSQEEGHGEIRMVEHPEAQDGLAVHYRKTGHNWFPQMWTHQFDLPEGDVYELSARLKAIEPNSECLLRMDTYVEGERVRLHEPVRLDDAFASYSFRFAVPEGADGVRVGIGPAETDQTAEFLIDAVALREARDRGNVVEHLPPEYGEGPYPIQGLDAFMERHGRKPYDLYQQDDGALDMHRVIFEDQQFGTEVWMIDDSPTVEHADTASVWWAWNIDGSALYLGGTRETEHGAHSGWFCEGDFSRMWPAEGSRPAVWDPEDPELYYAPRSPSDSVTRNNWRTGEQETVAEWEELTWEGVGTPSPTGKRIYGLTRDEEHIFVDLPNRGVFAPFTPDDDYPIPRLSLYDGRPIGPDGDSVGSNHFCVIRDHEEYGDLIALRTGMLISRDTGEKTYIVAPLCGNTNYLRAFYDGRVHYPEGEEWNSYGLPWFAEGVELPTDLDMDELYDLWLNIPHATHGHESPSPDWRYIVTDGGTTRIAHVRSGETEDLRLSPNGTNYHLHWRLHPRFFVGWVRGWHFGSYVRPQNGNIVYQIFSDLTAQPIFDTNHRFNGYYAGGDFSMQSPDATKIHTASSMTGRFRNYVAVMARPRPPKALTWEEDNGAVRLAWEPSAYSDETRGYLVYRSEQSGSGYELLTPDPVENTEWVDDAAEAGTPYYYVVTSLEHSGLESGYSAEAARAGVELPAGLDSPLVVYAEAEAAIRDLETDAKPGLAMGVDRRTASDWYYAYRHPDAEHGEAALDLDIPADDAYHVWARLRSEDGSDTKWSFKLADTHSEAGTDSGDWTWVRVTGEPVTLPEDETGLTFSTEGWGAAMDLLALATDEGFEPSGPRPERQTPPPAVE